MSRPATLCLSAVLVLVPALDAAAQARGGATGLTPARVQQVGASVPFTTYEAENAVTGGNGFAYRLTAAPTATTSNPEIEASGRGHVRLDHINLPQNRPTGGWVEFRNVRKANAMVLRHSIPDAPAGGGTTGTINLYVNGVFRQTLTLSSKHNWLYGEAGDNGQSNNPADGTAHVFWDDTRFIITGGGVKAGDNLKFQIDPTNTVGYCRIDLVDLEVIPAALPAPAAGTYVNVLDFGAVPNNAGSDTNAIANAITNANSFNPKKTVWIPPGTYIQTSKWTLNGVKVRGAGYWHTVIRGTQIGGDFAGHVGFSLRGTGSGVANLYVESTAHTARGDEGGRFFTGAYGETEQWRVENVWMHHGHNGFWMSGSDNGLISGNRLYFPLADAINVNRGASHNLVINNYVRGAGDDGIVTLSELQNGQTVNQIATNNTFRYNTIIANWWGHNAAIGGGGGHVYEYNHFADNSHAGVLSINLPDAYPKNPLTSCMVRGNVLYRGGSNFSNQKRGALWINTGFTTATATFTDNKVYDAIFRGVHFVGTEPQNITLTRTLIERPRENAVRIQSEVKGSATFIDTTIRGLNTGFSAFSDSGGSDHALTRTGTVILP